MTQLRTVCVLFICVPSKYFKNKTGLRFIAFMAIQCYSGERKNNVIYKRFFLRFIRILSF